MKIKLTLPEDALDYIRHVRRETLLAVGEDPHPELLEPSPFGFYLIAYSSDGQKPLGLAEFAFHEQVYRSFEDAPYPAESLGMTELAPLTAFAGTRTIYVEPEARTRLPPVYLLLSMAGSKFAREHGVRYSTASTDSANEYLMRLYRKVGGRFMGTYRDKIAVKSELALWVFDLEKLARHPAMKRLEGVLEIDPEIARTVRARTRWDNEPTNAGIEESL